jgi:hypothetical protein
MQLLHTMQPQSLFPYSRMHISSSEPMILEQDAGVSLKSGLPNFAPNHAPQLFGWGLEQSLFIWTDPGGGKVLASSLVGRAAQLGVYDNLLFQSRFFSSFFTIALLRLAHSFPIQ